MASPSLRPSLKLRPSLELRAKPGAEAKSELKEKPGAEAKLEAKAKLTAIVDALQTLANAWSALEEDPLLQKSVNDHLVGCLGVTSWRSSVPGEWDATAR